MENQLLFDEGLSQRNELCTNKSSEEMVEEKNQKYLITETDRLIQQSILLFYSINPSWLTAEAFLAEPDQPSQNSTA